MAEAVDMVNIALAAIGADMIDTLDQAQSKSQRLGARFWRQALGETLETGLWSCALTRVSLAADAVAPAFGYAFAYSVPGDCLRPIAARTDGASWRFERRKILTDAGGPLALAYLADVAPAECGPLLIKAAGLSLAHTIAVSLTESQSKRDALARDATDALRRAYFADAAASGTSPVFGSNWVLAHTSDTPVERADGLPVWG